MTYNKAYFRMVGIALLPATAASVAVVVIGGFFDIPESVVNRVSQLMFFPIFLAACYYLKSRTAEKGVRP